MLFSDAYLLDPVTIVNDQQAQTKKHKQLTICSGIFQMISGYIAAAAFSARHFIEKLEKIAAAKQFTGYHF